MKMAVDTLGLQTHSLQNTVKNTRAPMEIDIFVYTLQ